MDVHLTQQQPKRLTRFQRTPGQIKQFQLTERDFEIIRHVSRHRFLRSTHIMALLNGSAQQILRRLQLLYHAGYLDRPREQIEYYQQGSKPMAYGLGNKGAALLAQQDGIPRGKLDWTAKNREVGPVFLHHTLAVADCMVALEVAYRVRGDVRLITDEEILCTAPGATRRRRNPLGWRVTVTQKHQGGGTDTTTLGVIPDKMFGLHFVNDPEGKNKSYFCLECDRGTMPVKRYTFSQTSFFRKMVGYVETDTQGLLKQRYNLHRFRVLTVTTTEERVGHMIEANRAFNNGLGSRIFLFTDEASLARHSDILTLPWRNGRDERTTLLA